MHSIVNNRYFVPSVPTEDANNKSSQMHTDDSHGTDNKVLNMFIES